MVPVPNKIGNTLSVVSGFVWTILNWSATPHWHWQFHGVEMSQAKVILGYSYPWQKQKHTYVNGHDKYTYKCAYQAPGVKDQKLGQTDRPAGHRVLKV